jgi:predicted DNA-binding ribbon-helix-helix protein
MPRGGKRPGAGRPDAGTAASGTRSIRLPLCLWQSLEGLAVRRRTTVNAIVRESCEGTTLNAVRPTDAP